MKYLLDTHTFIWADSEPARLSPQVATLIRNQANTVVVSLVTIWEIQIKHQLGKLSLTMPLAEIIQKQQNENRIELLSITVPHVLALDALPMHHRDPFDRLLIAQARVENLILLSSDPMVAQYPVQVIW